MELEWLATGIEPNGAYPFDIDEQPESPLVIDTRPLMRAISADAATRTDAQLIARRFHSTIVEMIAAVCCRLRKASGLATVVLSGGVFMNALLTCEVSARLSEEGFRVFRHRLVPPNDGGLSLGQLAIAVAACGLASRPGESAKPQAAIPNV